MKSARSRKMYFYGVALATILFGAGVIAVGAVEWILNVFGSSGFSFPLGKVIGGAVILSLGYVHLELELLRTGGDRE